MFRFFENLVDPYCEYDENDSPPTEILPFILGYCRPFYGVFLFLAVLASVIAAFEIGLVYFTGWIVDKMHDNPENFIEQYGAFLLLLAGLIIFVRPLIMSLDVVLLNNTLMPNLGTLIRWRAHRHVLRQSIGWFENDFAGRIANRVMQTPPSTNELVFHVFDALSFALAYVVGSAIILWQADARLTIPLFIWFSLYTILIFWVVRNVTPASRASSDARSRLNGHVVDSYTNIHSVKMFAHESLELELSKKAIENTRKTVKLEMRIYTLMDIALVLLNGFLMVGIVGWSIILWYQNKSTPGIVAASCALVLRLNGMTSWIMWAVTSFFRELGVVVEGMGTIAQPIQLKNKLGVPNLKIEKAKIEFKKVTHSYGHKIGGLSDLNLKIAPGEKIGLVGRSGAGKSTLVKLLMRFYDAEQGVILIDGQDISSVTQQSLRKQVGMVQQESSLLHRSVTDNIRYGKKDATKREILKAAKKAEAHEFIIQLQDSRGRKGYDAHVGERGVKLSGGQRQRIALARVILKDAPILLLDEATSALDSELEASIQKTLYSMMEGKTVVAIAHRLSTIAHMDRILVLNGGQIKEQGTHLELLNRNGLYSNFWSRQSGGFINVK